MELADYLGFAGVSLILVGYFLNLRGSLSAEDLSYILLNFVGSALACTASILLNYIPFIILEGVWFVVSINFLFRYFKRRKSLA